ncbi:MAG TPA: hypothetical protein VGK73_37040, partial [Polyangiaceae bacterium]
LDCATVPLRKEYERLRRDDVDYFVVRKHPTDSKRASVYETYVVGRPVFSDERTKVYSIADLLRQRLPCDP